MDALDSLERFGRVTEYGDVIELGSGIRATFFDAGHILGSASVLVEAIESGEKRRILFSGDIGPPDRPFLNRPTPPTDVDVVVMESTYGDRDHRPLDASVAEFYEAIGDALERGGNIIIPTFALERAQELLFYLRKGVSSGEISPSIYVFLDSPMAISATRLFQRHPEGMNSEIANMLHDGKDPFDLPNLRFTRDTSESVALNRIRSGAIITAGSGMCTGGRVRHHLRHNLGHSDCSVIFVGYAAEGTLARIIIEGANSVKLFGENVPVRARIHTINGFSAHAGQKDLIEWHNRTGRPKTTFLVHGERQAMEALAAKLKAKGIERPSLHQSYEL